MIDFSNGPLVTPERTVVLSVFCVGVPGSCEDLVPERGVAVGVRSTVRRLSAGEDGARHMLGGLETFTCVSATGAGTAPRRSTRAEWRNKKHTLLR